MARMVLLRHTLGDGSWHYDWLLARAEAVGDDERSLVAMRVGARVDGLERVDAPCERLADHRGRYLRFEGDIGGGRGVVARVAQGECVVEREGEGEIVARARWEGGSWLRLRAARDGGEAGDRWRVRVEPAENAGAGLASVR